MTNRNKSSARWLVWAPAQGHADAKITNGKSSESSATYMNAVLESCYVLKSPVIIISNDNPHTAHAVLERLTLHASQLSVLFQLIPELYCTERHCSMPP